MIARPGKIVCVGRNFAPHAAELGHEVPSEPLLFLKPPSALIPSGAPIRIPPDAGRVDFEGEIGLVIGRAVRRAPESHAWEHVGGVLALNDVTARDLQRRDGQWSRAKGFDTFCPAGEPVDARDLDPAALTVSTRVNGEERQFGRAGDLVFSLSAVISYVSRFMTLEPGDLVAAGTPEGVGPLAPGDTVEVALSCGSSVRNPVEADEPLERGGAPSSASPPAQARGSRRRPA